ncbi:MAG: hypothetical protein P4N24_01900, partial [Acidobacteriota bacterium]|nr:hypothetical protein [Acidobacteriota bacterium]
MIRLSHGLAQTPCFPAETILGKMIRAQAGRFVRKSKVMKKVFLLAISILALTLTAARPALAGSPLPNED